MEIIEGKRRIIVLCETCAGCAEHNSGNMFKTNNCRGQPEQKKREEQRDLQNCEVGQRVRTW